MILSRGYVLVKFERKYLVMKIPNEVKIRINYFR